MYQMKKEELEITISDSDRIECAIRHIKTAVDVDPWAVEIAVEAMKTQLSVEGTTSDLISRQAAINTVKKHYRVDNDLLEVIVYQLENLPSAQPDVPDKNVGDIISRQAAIETARTMYERCDTLDMLDYCNLMLTALKELPSAQPEIVRCKECMHHRRDNTGCYYCVRKEYGYGWGLNDFCSDAERRTNEPDR